MELRKGKPDFCASLIRDLELKESGTDVGHHLQS